MLLPILLVIGLFHLKSELTDKAFPLYSGFLGVRKATFYANLQTILFLRQGCPIMQWLARRLIKWFTRFETQKQQFFCDFDAVKSEIRPCDVLLVEGHNMLAKVIQQVTLSPWTHSALYIGRAEEISDPEMRERIEALPWVEPKTQILIEGYLGYGTILNPLEFYRSYSIRLCRPRGLLRSDAQQVIAAALEHWGALYDIVQIFDLARFLMPWSFIPRRWRSSLFSYRPGAQTKTVCSTMIAESFLRVKFPILPLIKVNRHGSIELYQRNPKLYTPKDFDYSPYFEILKFPFLRTIDMETYKELPWNKEGLLANDLEVFDPYKDPTPVEESTIKIAEKVLTDFVKKSSQNQKKQ